MRRDRSGREPGAGAGPGGWAPMTVRVASHVVVWATLLVPLAVVLARGWIPSGDDAAIAIRSYQTLTIHPPAIGLVSTAGTTAHYVFDPGPLLFWLLALPVRIDPLHGALWGAAILSGIILSVAIEALWSARQWLGCAVVAFAIADYLLFAPAVIENIMWNAYFPIPFFIAAIALAWIVAGGSFGWWPVLVFAGSVAAQSQLIFTLPAAALVVTAPLIAMLLTGRPARLRWLVTGLAVGAACWLAPLIQGIGANSNLSALATSGRGLPRMGLRWGLQTLGTIGSPSPLWLHHLPLFPDRLLTYFSVLGSINANSPVLGIGVLVVIAVIAVVAHRAGRTMLAAVSIVALVCSTTTGLAFGLVPAQNSLSFAYMIDILWAVSILVWSAVVWALGLLAVGALRRLGRSLAVPEQVGRRTTWGWTALVAPAVVLALGIAALRSYQPGLRNVGTRASDVEAVPSVVSQVERVVPDGRVDVRVDETGRPWLESFWLSEAVAWSLEADGRHPGLDGLARAYTGLVPQPGSAVYRATVDPSSSSVVVRIEPVR
jgi:hypothetical protein